MSCFLFYLDLPLGELLSLNRVMSYSIVCFVTVMQYCTQPLLKKSCSCIVFLAKEMQILHMIFQKFV